MRRRASGPIPAVLAAVSVAAWVGISLSTVFWTAIIAVVWALHPWIDPELRRAHRLCSCWGRTLVRMAPASGVRLLGLERIPAGRPVIFMANHQSYVDVPALFFMPGQFKWMADEGLFRIPVFGWAMRMAGYVPVSRGDARAGVQALERAKQWLQRGISVFIFPEGTRSRTGVFGRFQMGGVRLAAESGVPVVPVVVTGTRQLLPRGSWIFRWGIPIEIRILPPMEFPSDLHSARAQGRVLRERMWAAFGHRVREIRRGFTGDRNRMGARSKSWHP